MVRAYAWVIAVGLCAEVGADSQVPIPRELSLFTITKSENKNVVQYAVRADEHCAPASGTPVYAYWRMLEQGPTSTAPLLAREIKAYGLASQQIVAPESPGSIGAVRVVLSAVPDRQVLVETSRASDGTCRALSTVRIAAAPAHLSSVYAKLKWPFGVEYLLLQGSSIDGSHKVEEKVGS